MSTVLGFKIYDQSLDQLDLSKARVINTINPHSYCVTKKDKYFKRVLKQSDILLPDGIGIVWAAKLLHGKKMKKIAGYDIFQFLMHKLNEQEKSCFFLGASSQTLERIEQRARVEFPNVKVYSYSPPYKKDFSPQDSQKMIDEVNLCKPQVLFVGMTAPKQEKWAFQFKDELKADVICSVGAVFDFYSGTVKRPSKFWINMGLEWLPRFIKEPRRLAQRNLVSTPTFIKDVLLTRMGRPASA